MCNAKNLSLIIGAMRTCMFVKFAIDYKIVKIHSNGGKCMSCNFLLLDTLLIKF